MPPLRPPDPRPRPSQEAQYDTLTRRLYSADAEQAAARVEQHRAELEKEASGRKKAEQEFTELQTWIREKEIREAEELERAAAPFRAISTLSMPTPKPDRDAAPIRPAVTVGGAEATPTQPPEEAAPVSTRHYVRMIQEESESHRSRRTPAGRLSEGDTVGRFSRSSARSFALGGINVGDEKCFDDDSFYRSRRRPVVDFRAISGHRSATTPASHIGGRSQQRTPSTIRIGM